MAAKRRGRPPKAVVEARRRAAAQAEAQAILSRAAADTSMPKAGLKLDVMTLLGPLLRDATVTGRGSLSVSIAGITSPIIQDAEFSLPLGKLIAGLQGDN